ncbi:hypothetical protein DPMN_167415 [Dreissena polymorpha]|uniref:Uncharacterized protein n=1 Tax=Dreissena polymorpha TaxID=45954 RepID=A0A9D4F3V3_DREPO|nr:hypothetical protein DPMN_167415 [Dreissena polymorpha]
MKPENSPFQVSILHICSQQFYPFQVYILHICSQQFNLFQVSILRKTPPSPISTCTVSAVVQAAPSTRTGPATSASASSYCAACAWESPSCSSAPYAWRTRRQGTTQSSGGPVMGV